VGLGLLVLLALRDPLVALVSQGLKEYKVFKAHRVIVGTRDYLVKRELREKPVLKDLKVFRVMMVSQALKAKLGLWVLPASVLMALLANRVRRV
jgi:hypothetical protein